MTVSSEVYPVRARAAAGLPMRGSSRLLTAAVALPLALFFLLPLLSILLRSFDTADGFGLGNFAATLSTARFWELVRNSVAMSALATVLAVSLAYLYAYGIQRTQVPGKSVLRIIAC